MEAEVQLRGPGEGQLLCREMRRTTGGGGCEEGWVTTCSIFGGLLELGVDVWCARASCLGAQTWAEAGRHGHTSACRALKSDFSEKNGLKPGAWFKLMWLCCCWGGTLPCYFIFLVEIGGQKEGAHFPHGWGQMKYSERNSVVQFTVRSLLTGIAVVPTLQVLSSALSYGVGKRFFLGRKAASKPPVWRRSSSCEYF